MKKLFCNSFFKNYLVLFLGFFLNEIIFRLISGLSLLSWGVLRTFLFVSILTFILTFLLNFANNVIRKIISSILVFASSVYAIAQVGFINFIGVYASFQTSSQLGAVTSYIKDFIASFKFYYYLPAISFILFLVFSIFFDKKFNGLKKLNVKKASLVTLIGLIVSVGLFAGSIIPKTFQNKFQTVSNKELFLTASNPTVTIEQYGTLGFCFLDVKAMLFPVTIQDTYEVKNVVKKEVNENSRLIDDSAWKQLIAEEDNETYNYLNNYFINRDITDKNEKTGLFAGKNLIMIMMESADDILINPDYYPNFYKLYSEGWSWENNYSPRNSCATMNNEFSGMVSLYSIYNTCTASKYKSNNYSSSIFGVFNKANYTTWSAHDYTQAYYPRKTIHTNMGSGEYYGVERLGISYSNEYVNWADDDDFMKEVLKIIDKKSGSSENFMTWLTTVSGHQPYTSPSIQGDRYYNMTKGTGYPTDVRRYMSKLKILDNGLGDLIQGLEDRGILEDTVIVLFGDHYPYGISTSHLNKALDYKTNEDYNAEQVPFVIYNAGTTDGTVYTQYTSYMNILPTIANLFGLDYDPRYYLGQDLFSPDYQSLTVFADGSWKNEKAYYNASKNKIKYYTSDEYTAEEIAAINNNIDEMTKVSSKAIKSNYFSYLDKNIAKTKEEIEELSKTQCLNSQKDTYLEAAQNEELNNQEN